MQWMLTYFSICQNHVEKRKKENVMLLDSKNEQW